MQEELKRVKMENSDVDADGSASSSQALGRTREGFEPSVHMSIWEVFSYQLGTTFLQLTALELHSTSELSCFWNM